MRHKYVAKTQSGKFNVCRCSFRNSPWKKFTYHLSGAVSLSCGSAVDLQSISLGHAALFRALLFQDPGAEISSAPLTHSKHTRRLALHHLPGFNWVLISFYFTVSIIPLSLFYSTHLLCVPTPISILYHHHQWDFFGVSWSKHFPLLKFILTLRLEIKWNQQYAHIWSHPFFFFFPTLYYVPFFICSILTIILPTQGTLLNHLQSMLNCKGLFAIITFLWEWQRKVLTLWSLSTKSKNEQKSGSLKDYVWLYGIWIKRRVNTKNVMSAKPV